MAELPPSTSEEIAKQAGLNERYVREWLGAMVTGRIVNYDPDDANLRAAGRACGVAHARRDAGEFRVGDAVDRRARQRRRQDRRMLPATAAACITKQFHRFHEVMAEESAQTVVAALTDHILPLCRRPRATTRARASTCWTSAAAAAGPFADWRPSFPTAGSSATTCATTPSPPPEPKPNAEASTTFASKRATCRRLGDKDKFDLITAFDAIHDQAKPDVVLREIVSRAAARRHVPDAGHSGVEPPGKERRQPDRAVPVHDLDDALHDRVARPGRRGPGHLLGPRAGRENARATRACATSPSKSCRTTT